MSAKPERPRSETEMSTGSGHEGLRNLVRRASGAVDLGVATAGTLFAYLPGTARATRVRASATTSALRLLPDSTLHGLAASSIGLGAGFYLAGLPRLITAAAMTPAMIIGAAIALRPMQPSLAEDTDGGGPAPAPLG